MMHLPSGDARTLVTKFHAPKPRGDWVARPRLVERLQGGLRSGARLSLVCAPAGYGKTSLVADWLAGSRASVPDRRAAWLWLDEGDNEAGSFFTYLLAALRRMLPGLDDRTESLLALPQLPAPGSLMAALINDTAAALDAAALDAGASDAAVFHAAALDAAVFRAAASDRAASNAAASSGAPAWRAAASDSAGSNAASLEAASQHGPYVLVLDDYHLIHNVLLHEAMELLVNKAPAGLHLVLITREDPPFPLSRLRGRGEMTEIRAADLRFRPDEVQLFFRQALPLPLAPEIVSALGERCEGWAVGLRMASLSLKECEDPAGFVAAFNGSDRYVTDFLMEEVLSCLPAATQAFLLRTAVLDRFNAELCSAVFGPDEREPAAECSRILAELERSNLFIIPLDSSHTWFRYHHLFADLLRSRLVAPARAVLHRRAALWLEGQGLLPEAVQHALDAEDPALAARLIRRAASGAVARADLGLLAGWLQQLPDATIHGDAELAIYKALLLLLTGKYEATLELLGWLELQGAVQEAPLLRDRMTVLRAWVDLTMNGRADVEAAWAAYQRLGEEGLLFKVLACHPLGNAQLQAGDARSASAIFLEGLRIGRGLPNPAAALVALYGAGRSLNAEGRRSTALRLCTEALPGFVDRHFRPLPPAGLILIPLGVLQYEANEVAAAIESLTTGLELCRQISPALIAIEGSLVMAHIANGEVGKALEIIREARTLAEGLRSPRVLQLVDLVETNACLRLGRVTEAAEAFARTGLPLDAPLLPERDRECLTGVRLILAQGRAEAAATALALLGRLEDNAREGGRMRLLINARVLRSLACLALGRRDDAAQALGDAVRLAAPERYLRLFLDEDVPGGPAFAELLPEVRQVAPAFVDALTGALGAGAAAPAPRDGFGPAGRGARPASCPNILSEREWEVLQLMAEGRSNQEIAEALVLAVATVKRHNGNIFNKLGADNRTQAIVQARRLGIL